MKKDKKEPIKKKTPILFLIEIVSCRVKTYWYADKIGKKMFVIDHETEEGAYRVVELFSDQEGCHYYTTGFRIQKSNTIKAKTW